MSYLDIVPHQQIPSWQRRFARSMRNQSTDAEALLWWAIRRSQLGVRFRRQHPVGPFIVDFVCLSHGVIVEADGEQHGGEADRRRDSELERRGFVVLRFWNSEVFTELDMVLRTIERALNRRSV